VTAGITVIYDRWRRHAEDQRRYPKPALRAMHAKARDPARCAKIALPQSALDQSDTARVVASRQLLLVRICIICKRTPAHD